jgi:DNA-binding NtrC family response regulator
MINHLLTERTQNGEKEVLSVMPDKMSYSLPAEIVATSDEMRELVGVIRNVAPTMITVLLTGESGSGKEVFARLIHDWSSRKDGPFVTVNCGAIPEGLIESELFGHEKGAFTGASAERKGFFEVANDGTIFLDEVGEMPLTAQVKLLRVLETGKFTRVGSAKERETNARVIAATNRDLELEVRAGRFRADLYYRLRAVMLRLPPLRNRREDIPFLIEQILSTVVQRHKLPHAPHIHREAIEALMENEWRGNIRELRNVLEQLAITSFGPHRGKDNGDITREDVDKVLLSHEPLPELHGRSFAPIHIAQRIDSERSELGFIWRALIELRAEMADIKHLLGYGNQSGAIPLPAGNMNINGSNGVHTLVEAEQEAISKALDKYHGNRKLAAEALGISERTLYRKLPKEMQIDEQPGDQLEA